MKRESLQQIKNKLGSRATDSPYECAHYSRDLASLPGYLVNPFFDTMPDLVVRPSNVEEVAEILKRAYDEDIPITPRAGGSTVYFDCVPSRGGIVVDLNLIQGVVKHDKTEMTATAKAGTTWSDLDQYLNPKGFASQSFPSSAPVATVGGWFCMMGYGIGSLKYGSLLTQTIELEVVMPTGEIQRLTRDTDPPLDWFFASEGTLGIVTEIKLGVRKRNPMKHFLIWLPDMAELTKILSAIKESKIIPYNLHFTDPQYINIMHKLGFSPGGIDRGCLLAVDYEGSPAELSNAELFITVLAKNHHDLNLLPEKVAEEEWTEKFNAMRIKRDGPSIIGGEVWLPLKELSGYWEDIQNMAGKYHLGIMSYGHIVTPDHVTVMSMFFTDENRILRYIFDLSVLKNIHDLGIRHCGHPYGIGLWNTPYIKRIFHPSRLKEMRERKNKLDPKGLMNPGKIYYYPPAMNPFCFGVAMGIISGISRLTGRDRWQ